MNLVNVSWIKKSSIAIAIILAGSLARHSSAAKIIAPFDQQVTLADPMPAASFELTRGPANRPRADAFIENILRTAEKYSKMTFIPYIWGGGNVSTKEVCQQCTKCVAKSRGTVAFSSRLYACDACQKCGMDCSHFVNNIYSESGLDYPFAATAELARLSARQVEELYSLVEIGNDPRKAQPGDLLLYPNHVTLLLKPYADGTGDFIHITRVGKPTPTGGIALRYGRQLANYRGRLLKILRHAKFFEVPIVQPLSQAPTTGRHPSIAWNTRSHRL